MNSHTLPPEWKHGHVSDIAIINPSVRLDGLEPNDEVTFLTMADVGENGRILNRQVRHLREVRNGFTRFEEGDVLFAKITPCMQNGKGAYAIGLTNGHGFGSTEFHVIRANEHGDSMFLSHVSLSHELRSKAVSYFSGSAGQQRVSSDFFARYPIFIPPRPQQRKIARILTTVDNLIEKTEALIAKYQAIKQGMMHDLFTRGVNEHGQLRPPYEEAPELYKRSELGWIPKDWDTDELNNRTLQIIDGTHFTPIYTEEGVPFLRVTDIQEDEISFDRLKFISEREHRILCQRCLPQRGDILLSKNGTIGIPKIVEWDWTFSIFVSLALIRPKHGHIDTRFLYYILLSNIVWEQIRRRSKQGTVTNLHLEEIRELVVPLPEAAEQERITVRMDAINSMIRSEESFLTKLTLRKTGLMQDLLTGKVRVKVDETKEAVHV